MPPAGAAIGNSAAPRQTRQVRSPAKSATPTRIAQPPARATPGWTNPVPTSAVRPTSAAAWMSRNRPAISRFEPAVACAPAAESATPASPDNAASTIRRRSGRLIAPCGPVPGQSARAARPIEPSPPSHVSRRYAAGPAARAIPLLQAGPGHEETDMRRIALIAFACAGIAACSPTSTGTVGGAAVGATVGGPVGAVVGGTVGAVAGGSSGAATGARPPHGDGLARPLLRL